MQDIQKLLEKYWSGTVSEAEKKWLYDYFSSDDPALFEWMKNDFSRNLGEGKEYLAPGDSERILQEIRKKLPEQDRAKENAPSRTIHMPLRWAAAALVLAATGLAIFLLNTGRPRSAAPGTIARTQPAPIRNNRDVMVKVSLPDGSYVLLYPGSAIILDDSFNIRKRDLRLYGTARFTVFPGKDRPFSVDAAGIVTTAVGTMFTIRQDSLSGVNVKLHEGKVVLRSALPDLFFNEVYLEPGDEMNADLLRKQYYVRAAAKKDEPAALSATTGKKPGPAKFAFRKEKLGRVFDRLSDHYNVPVRYNAAEMQKMLFTGTFSASDPLPDILSVIAELNDLDLQKEGRGYHISLKR